MDTMTYDKEWAALEAEGKDHGCEMERCMGHSDEIQLAFQIADRYISIQEVDDGYDYSIMAADYKEIDGGIYDNPDVTIREALNDIVHDLKTPSDNHGVKGTIRFEDELIPIDYEGLMDKVEKANAILPTSTHQESIIAAFRAKTNERFQSIQGMDPEEIEELVTCHVEKKICEYEMDAAVIAAVIVGSRSRGLENSSSDLDVVVEIDTDEREDDLFNAFHEDELHIGEVKVDINPITEQRSGTLETYLPKAESYLESKRKEMEKKQSILL